MTAIKCLIIINATDRLNPKRIIKFDNSRDNSITYLFLRLS